jgi:alpha-L-rhamnosidase
MAKSNGRYIIDFGQNFSGWVKLKLADKKGKKVTLRFAESLQENGELFTANLRDAKATDYYTFKGEGIEEWEPKFTYHGFRYVEVSGLTKAPAKENFTGRFVYDNMQTVGTFESSNSLLNQIHKNAWWGIASNYKGMPVDCPQRNERQPWLGDRPTSAYGESFLFNNTRLYTKWLDDITDAQKPDGAIPDVAPAFWRYYSDNMTWPSALPLITQMIHTQTGDLSIISKKYPAIKKWLQYMTDQYLDDDGILTKDSYGDWCVPPVTAEAGRGVNADQKHPSALLATAYYAHLSGLMATFAGLIGNKADSVVFIEQANKAKAAFHKKFYHEAGFYGENNLTDNLLPVYFDIVPEALKPLVWKRVAEIVEVDNKNHLSTGLVGVQWLMRGLEKIGRSDLAYKVATQTTYPSWGYMVKNGATTIWELWNGNTAAPSMNSQNHVMLLGDLLVWYYENLAGIKSSEEQVGFKQIIMKPSFVKELGFVNASYQSPYGTIKSHWQQSAKTFHWDVTIPPNATALIYFPTTDKNKVIVDGKNADKTEGIHFKKIEDGKAVFEVGSGSYSFDVKQ